MKKTDFSFLPDKKQLHYEQMARSYRINERQKNTAWTNFEGKLIESKIALISVCGAYLKSEKAFTGGANEQNYAYQPIDINFDRDDLEFMALDWETSEVALDINVVLPIDRLVLLQKEGLIGKINDNLFSFSGVNENRDLLDKSIKKLIKELKKEECHGALIIPCSAKTAETACLIASQVEAAKISTALLTPFYEQALIMSPPRCAFINFPFGRVLGKSKHVTLHTAILRDTLRLFEKAKVPGDILNLNFIWSYEKIPNW
ncbi:hypothetical protein KJ762_08380 [bacterium]|nr:hypothetical protein [bacterium]MBU1063424.1 hypothetical protein [bacterium]MBU1634510.1 hypothetical protein [bacterium]MBU1874888.1 hypothetical protein [bacterium]